MNKKNEQFRIVACSPPSCSCPELTFEEDVDGNTLVVIADDFNGVCVMTPKEFEMLAEGFLNEINKG
jgi:hypothetical protein